MIAIKIRELCKNALGNKSIKNGLWLYGLQFFNTIFPLITLPYITRILGPSSYGSFSIVLNIILYLQVIVEYGFGLSATRQVNGANQEKLNKIFSAVVISRFILYIISLILSFAYILFAQRSSVENKCIFILSIMLVGYCLQQNWIFQGKQDMKFISITNIFSRLVCTILIFIIVKTPDHLLIYCLLYSLSPLFSNILGFIIVIFKYKIRFRLVGLSFVLKTLKDGVYIFFTQMSSKIFSSIGITFLGFFTSEYDVGIYSAINKIPYLMILIWNPIAQVIYPVSCKKIDESFEKGYNFVIKIKNKIIILFSAILFIVGCFSKFIIGVFLGLEYANYYYIVYPMLLWVLFGVINNFYGVQILVGSHHDKEYSFCFQIGIIVTILLNLILIYLFNIVGAAIAPLVSEIILYSLLRIKINKVKKQILKITY